MKLPAFLLLLAAHGASAADDEASASHLNYDNFHIFTAGKAVFLNFFEPGCSDCEAMKPDWEKMMQSLEKSETKLVANVECGGEWGDSICRHFGVKEFPTLKWGDPTDLQDYTGGRSYEDLKEFAEKLQPLCGAENLEACDTDKKAFVERLMGMSYDELLTAAAEEEAKAKAVEDDYDDRFDDLDDRFEDLEDKGASQKELDKLEEEGAQLEWEKYEAIVAIEEAGLRMMRTVIKLKGMVKPEVEEVEEVEVAAVKE